MDLSIENTPKELHAYKIVDEAKYGIKVLDEEKYFDTIKNRRAIGILLFILIAGFVFALGLGVGFSFGVDWANALASMNCTV